MRIAMPQSRLSLFWLLMACGLAAPISFAAINPSVTYLGAHQQPAAPARVATDSTGHLYVSQSAAGKVSVLDAFGRLISVKTGLGRPLGLAVDSQGRIFLAEEQNGSVAAFDLHWNLLFRLGNGQGEFAMPNYIALAPGSGSNLVYVSDSAAHQIKAYQEGSLVLRFGAYGTGPGQFDFPVGLCFDSAGELLVVDQNNDRIEVFDGSGNFLRQFSLVTPLGSGLGSAGGRSQGIAADAQGRIFVADSFQSMIRVFDTQGAYLGTIGGVSEANGLLRTPAGIALDSYNRLFVASLNSSHVEIFGLDSFLHFSATPPNYPLAQGANLALSVRSGGAGPFADQWTKDGVDLSDSGNISGSTTSTLTLTGVGAPNSGTYSVVVNGALRSPGTDLLVLQPPAITQAPASQTVFLGSNATFTVVAQGSPTLIYQWRKDHRDLSGQTNALLSLPRVDDLSAATYTIVVSNAVGTATADASLAIAHPPLLLDATAQTTVNTPRLFTTSELLYTAASPDQLPLNVSAVSPPTVAGSSAVLAAGSVTYIPATNYVGNDGFQFTLSDGRGGSATATMLLSVLPASAAAASLDLPVLASDGLELRFGGISGRTYTVERTASLNPPTWVPVAQVIVGTGGVAVFTDTNAPPAGAFYRAVYP